MVHQGVDNRVPGPLPHPGARPISRLAPSPTGALHLGNARTFLVNWALARSLEWELVLRIEDLDPRARDPEAARLVMDDLAWLGLDWDEGPFFQSGRGDAYAEAIARLEGLGLTYPCFCTRSESTTPWCSSSRASCSR